LPSLLCGYEPIGDRNSTTRTRTRSMGLPSTESRIDLS
jgi:hypothetical protein